MAQRNGTRDHGEDPTRTGGDSPSDLRTFLSSVGDLTRGLGFWSAIVLPFVAVALLALQPPGWVPALVAVLAVDVGAVFVGHCHDREC